MKYFFLSLLLLLASCSSYSEIYIVRHAEKAGSADDSTLTPQGESRAQALASLLAGKEIACVYATRYLRNRLTAQPTADVFGLPVELYHHDTLPLFIQHRIQPGKNYLIVGHSNTVLEIVKALGAQPALSEIRDEDYDYLFIVTQKHTPFGKKTILTETTFKPQ